MIKKVYFSREEMYEMNEKRLRERGVTIEDIAKIAFQQQSKYSDNIDMLTCIESVKKILSYRDIFHMVQLFIEIDVLAENKKLSSPIQEIIESDLGMFGVDELVGLDIASYFGTIGETNFGDIDINKPGIVKILNDNGKKGQCHTFLDDVVGAIAAAASTRVSQILSEDKALNNKVINDSYHHF